MSISLIACLNLLDKILKKKFKCDNPSDVLFFVNKYKYDIKFFEEKKENFLLEYPKWFIREISLSKIFLYYKLIKNTCGIDDL